MNALTPTGLEEENLRLQSDLAAERRYIILADKHIFLLEHSRFIETAGGIGGQHGLDQESYASFMNRGSQQATP